MRNAIEKFEQKNIAAFQALAFISSQKKQLDAQEKELKAQLLDGMKKYGIDAIDNDVVRINLIPETETVSIDTKAWKKDDPESYHEIEDRYNKRVKKSEYVRITVK